MNRSGSYQMLQKSVNYSTQRDAQVFSHFLSFFFNLRINLNVNNSCIHCIDKVYTLYNPCQELPRLSLLLAKWIEDGEWDRTIVDSELVESTILELLVLRI